MGQTGLVVGLLAVILGVSVLMLWRRKTADRRRVTRRQQRRERFQQRDMIDMFGDKRSEPPVEHDLPK